MLAAFLYVLMRDHVVPGEVERIVSDLEDVSSVGGYSFSNEHLERYAKELERRLVADKAASGQMRW